MADKLMYIPNNDAQNYAFCSLQLEIEMFGHSIKVPKNVKTTNKKCYYKILGTSVINNLMSPPSLTFNYIPCIRIPVLIRYNLESVANLKSLFESPCDPKLYT